MFSFERCVVLVVDDEVAIVQLISVSLIRHGYEVISAAHGFAAISACEQRDGPIHLALLDVMMPGMDGPELYDHLKDYHPKIEVLFMSGYSRAQLPAIATTRFIGKPFILKTVVEPVNEILGNTDVCVLLDDETVVQV
jgi:two-component system cell cycle sensor histidine kinase/response regulator CckA